MASRCPLALLALLLTVCSAVPLTPTPYTKLLSFIGACSPGLPPLAPQTDYDESARKLAETAAFLPLGTDPTLGIDVQFPMKHRVLWPSQLKLYLTVYSISPVC
ncbi:hypothetical protein T484DRAFT_1766198 [Baffinella frigidus]|nr:hypothetical protein T484DRAFT_1766198 [Cryptophyta sp. CCMP2293]